MKKLFKTLICAAAAVCVTLGLVLFAACGDEPEKPDDKHDYYTVNITYPDGKGAEGIELQMTPENGTMPDEGDLFLTATTDESGKAEFHIAHFPDATLYRLEVMSGVPEGYNLQSAYAINLGDGFTLNATLTMLTYESISVKLDNKDDTQEFAPAKRFGEGYYVFRSIESKFSLTDGDEEFPATFNVSGYNSVIVYYTPDTVYDIGTADLLDFNIIFSMLESDGKTAESGHDLEGNLAVVLNLEVNQSVYLKNPDETGVMGQRGGYPLSVDGENYSAEVGGVKHTSPFLLAGGKTVKVGTADGAKGVAVIHFKNVSNSVSAEVGTPASLQIELLERTITENSGKTTALLWTSNSARFSFTANEAGLYKITVTSNFDGDKMAVTNLISGSSIVPEKVSSNGSTGGDFTVPMANPYEIIYRITESNIDASKGRSKKFTGEFSSGADFSSLSEGHKITYTILIEYTAE